MASSWTPQTFKFEPYELTIGRREEESAAALHGGSQRKSGGRQKRSSVICQVPGCHVELVSAKTYYKRYRICVNHCNATAMTIDGRSCRFCQQCGRFHDLCEFEDSRKSCRRKLKRHNERRRSTANKCRKWQSDSGDTDSADDAEAKAVANVKRSSTRPRLASIKQEPADAAVSTEAGRSHSTSGGNAAARVVPPKPARFTASVAAQPQAPVEPRTLTERLLHGLNGERGDAAPDSPGFGGFADLAGSNEGSGIAVPQLDPCPGALPAAGHQELEQALRPSGSAVSFQAMDTMQLMDMATLEDFLLPEDPSDSLILPTICQWQQQHFPSMTKGRSSTSYQDLPLAASVDDLPIMALPGEMASAADASAGPAAPPQHPTLHHHRQQQQLQQSSTAAPQGVLRAATGLVTAGPAAVPLVGYLASDRLLRVSLKVFNCTPAELMPAVRAELECLLRSSHSMLEASIRPGCTHVTLTARMDGLPAHAEHGLRQAIQALLDRNALGSAAGAGMIVQSGGELLVVKQRRVVAALNVAQSGSVLPRILSVRPMVVEAGQRRGVLLAGRRVSERSDLLMCRQQGRNLTVERSLEPAAVGAPEYVRASVLGLAPGLAEFEVQRGAFLGAARPLLVLPEGQAAAAAEIRQLEEEGGRSVGGPALDVDDFLRDAGLVVQYLDRGEAAAAGRAVPRYTRKLLQRIQEMACRLVLCAVARGWAASIRLLLPAVTAAGQSPAEAIAAMSSACPDGASLLHVAVGTGNAEVARALGAWAKAGAAAHCLAVDIPGPAGVTPLHVAALLSADEREAMHLALSGFASATGKLWGLVQADGGITPEALAEPVASGSRGVSGVSDASSSAAAEQAVKERAAAAAAAKGGPISQETAECCLPQGPQLRKSLRQAAKDRLNDVHVSGLVSEVMGLPSGQAGVPGGQAAALGGPLVTAALFAGALAAVVMYLT